MIEYNLLPDFVLNLEDGHAQPDYLLKRMIKVHGLQAENTKEDDEVFARACLVACLLLHVQSCVEIFFSRSITLL